MQKKRGISLIVLVITIIVMIILAGAIILSLNNAGIIGKANQAVDSTNEATVKQLADLKWSEAYLEGKRTADDLTAAVLDKLEEENVDIKQYDIVATDKGVSVNKLTTVEQLQENNEFYYYNSLSEAIVAANTDAIETNANADKANAKVGVYTTITSQNGTEKEEVNIVLLQNCVETQTIRPSTDMTINLGGKELAFAEGVKMGIAGASGYTGTIVIDGRLDGSKMIVYGANEGARLLQTIESTFVIKGGTYVAKTLSSTNHSEFSAMVLYCKGRGEITNADIIVEMSLENGWEAIDTKLNIAAVQAPSGELMMNNCTVQVNANKNIIYKAIRVIGIDVYSNNVSISNTKVNVSSKYSGPLQGESNFFCGVYMGENSKAWLNNCDVMAIHSAMTNRGEAVINGGTYQAYGVGMYTLGNATIQNATIKSVQVPQGYNYYGTNYYETSGRGLVIGEISNLEVYVNNCNIEGNENSIVLGNLYNEQNNKLYISNSKINTEKSILVQDASHKIHIGVGCNFIAANTSLPEAVESTDNTYIK